MPLFSMETLIAPISMPDAWEYVVSAGNLRPKDNRLFPEECDESEKIIWLERLRQFVWNRTRIIKIMRCPADLIRSGTSGFGCISRSGHVIARKLCVMSFKSWRAVTPFFRSWKPSRTSFFGMSTRQCFRRSSTKNRIPRFHIRIWKPRSKRMHPSRWSCCKCCAAMSRTR